VSGACGTNGGRRIANISVRNDEGKKPLGKHSCRLEYNIKMGFKK
jgi:hypothetical protein